MHQPPDTPQSEQPEQPEPISYTYEPQPVAYLPAYESTSAQQASHYGSQREPVTYGARAAPPQQHTYNSNIDAQKNQLAHYALRCGIAASVLAVLDTTAYIISFGVIVIAIFAISYGYTGLKIARQTPHKLGKIEAMIGIVLGFVACAVVVIVHIMRLRAH